jgi:predicted NAD/FAD-binding protein
MRVAVVGAGVSGLVAAYQLARTHDVTLYEANSSAGGHAKTVRVDRADKTDYVDTGFMVFNDRNYPLFRQLLSSLGVSTQATTMSFGVSDDAGVFEYANHSLNAFFACRRNIVSPSFHRMALDALRCQIEARRLVASNQVGGQSLGDWLDSLDVSQDFVQRMAVPLLSAIWSADPAQVRSFPARYTAKFFDHHGLLQVRNRPRWYTVMGGSHRYVESITQRLGTRLRLGVPIRAIERHPNHVTLTPQGGDTEEFDEVVIATHSNQALRILQDANDVERKVLGAIPYQDNEAVLHTDRRILPRRRRAWASWNFHIQANPVGRSTVTYYMNRLQRLNAHDEYCVTLNRTSAIDPARIIQTIRYSHPIYTAATEAAQLRHAEVSGHNRTHYCGAYWGWGFHEDGVASALRVAERFGVNGFV